MFAGAISQRSASSRGEEREEDEQEVCAHKHAHTLSHTKSGK